MMIRCNYYNNNINIKSQSKRKNDIVKVSNSRNVGCQQSHISEMMQSTNRQTNENNIIFALNFKLPSCIMQQTEANNIYQELWVRLCTTDSNDWGHISNDEKKTTTTTTERMKNCTNIRRSRCLSQQQTYTPWTHNNIIQHRIQNPQPNAEKENVLV